ncbi:type II toxin-antitoxin system HicB family antitoxin [Solwaraspora sp. WMMD792]|uniref:type II toxin-antitoxin system HicB family antitoxin n=1 Tax=Solwaraspora sp. WMMD792 TaxID=3016099 RepID=UPI0024178214|nr:type II toxin-antitoxin system HicB family antitoxin [Solwaraspora sp. WMMD792]MDG4771697.1 type II toxin-antitoxin system HicB family antitoxin [Solwaraspora sp. WMMD792]
MEVTTYSVVCRRVGNWWAISVPELKGVHTQARRLDQVAAMAREAIALLLGIEPVSVALDARRAARDADEKAEGTTAKAVLALLRDGSICRWPIGCAWSDMASACRVDGA